MVHRSYLYFSAELVKQHATRVKNTGGGGGGGGGVAGQTYLKCVFRNSAKLGDALCSSRFIAHLCFAGRVVFRHSVPKVSCVCP